MLLREYLITTRQYSNAKLQWQRLLEAGESVALIFPYMSDRMVRIRQFIDETNSVDLTFILLEPNLFFADNLFDFRKQLNQLVTGSENVDFETLLSERRKLALVTINGELFFTAQYKKYLDYLQHLASQNVGMLTFLTCYETNIRQQVNSFYAYDLLFQNIIYYPLYDKPDMKLFINSLSEFWNIPIDDKKVAKIIDYTGGSFWLAKQVLRVYREEGKLNLQDESVQERLKEIIKIFSQNELEVFYKLIAKSNVTNNVDYTHLNKTGYISNERRINVAGLTPIIESMVMQDSKLTIQNNEILYKKINIGTMLSNNEELLLKLFIEKAGKILTRENIAKLLWGSNQVENYSPWAIDQSVKRLRDKLSKLGLPKGLIRSVRGVGYEYRSE